LYDALKPTLAASFLENKISASVKKANSSIVSVDFVVPIVGVKSSSNLVMK
jgi:hypothetical protein